MEIEPVRDDEEMEDNADIYYSMEDMNGCLRCSCGRELKKIDEETYRCPGGFPVYRFKNGDIVIDRFGNLMVKKLAHPKEQEGGA